MSYFLNQNSLRVICIDAAVTLNWKNKRQRFFIYLGRIGVWRLPGTRFQQQNVVPMRNSGRVTQMYWAAMSYYGRGRLIRVNQRMKKEQYVRVLKKYLLPYVNHLFPGDQTVYILQDNSPVHTSHLVQTWFSEHPRLQLLLHPRRSPDLNPIGKKQNIALLL